MTASVLSTLPLPLFIKGKVRDVYDLDSMLLLVASDRISAFDYVLPTPIPDKGKILTQLSAFWFDTTRKVVPNHLVTCRVDQFPDGLRPYEDPLRGRTMLVRKTRKILIECVVRGYLAGSGWKEYRQSRTVCGIPLPEGLQESSRLPEPIFTPATKEEQGKHDENISFERMGSLIGEDLSRKLRELSLALYQKASAAVESRGLLLADTKFEFGLLGNDILLIDEALTPDSSRFWEQARWQPGKSQDSIDKQFVRDYLESIHWSKQPPVPSLPPEIVRKTREKYVEAFERITGKAFEP